jgi:DNA polymerase III sliding clamp (beta) subunit (PCNA family)
MRVTAAAADLSAALKHSVAARTTPMPVLQHALLTTGDNVLHLETSDVEIYMRHTIPAVVHEAGSICLVDALLRTIASGGGDVVLNDTGKVSRGRSHFTVPALAANEFPTPESSQFTALELDPEALREAIRAVDYAYEDGDIRAFVRALHIEPGRVWCINGSQAGRVALDYQGAAIRVPGAQLKRLAAALVEGARVLADVRNGGVAMLRVETDTMQITVRCIEGSAPDIDAVVPRLGTRNMVRVNRRELADSVRRMLPFLAAKAKQLPVIRITQSAEGLGVMDKDGGNTEFVAIEPQDQVDALEMGLDASRLLAALGALADDVVELYLHTTFPTVILPDGGDPAKVVHVIMPCRL